MTRGFTRVPNPLVCGELRHPDGSRLSLGAQALYVVILHYSRSGDRPCTTSQATLSRHLGVTVRRVRDWLRELEQLGLVKCERGGRYGTNRMTPQLLPERQPSSGHERMEASDKEEAKGEEDNNNSSGEGSTVAVVARGGGAA